MLPKAEPVWSQKTRKVKRTSPFAFGAGRAHDQRAQRRGVLTVGSTEALAVALTLARRALTALVVSMGASGAVSAAVLTLVLAVRCWLWRF
jgi:hypothetical protein